MKFFNLLNLLLLLVAGVAHSSAAESTAAFRPRRASSLQKYQLEQQTTVLQPSSDVSMTVPSALSNDVSQVARGGAISNSLAQTLKVGFYFGLWYLLNIFYNIFNKKLLNVMPAPLTIGSIQLAIGSAYVAALWLLRLRPAPFLNSSDAIKQFAHVGFWHAFGQETTMVSLCAGAVSFTHIVKALEPFFSSVVSALAFKQWMPLPVYLSLVPVVGGVGYACLKESAFSWLAFSAAMLSNLAFALRAVLSKVAMGTAVTSGRNLTSPNVFALVTMFGLLFSIPMAIAGEASSVAGMWSKALESMPKKQLVQAILVSGLFHYLNNEVMYLALGNVHPVTLAVGNTMKRVFIMVASVMVFRNPISLQAGIGSAVGISGVLVYSLVKQHYEKVDVKVADKVKSTARQTRVGVTKTIPSRVSVRRK
ncbi:hypothetical protein MPSEU_001000100 [Mayamaea pseudoterrestris]|nr:hypothetical protein MPSEU_001000100 [Mayamaea pseudoterrestris]